MEIERKFLIAALPKSLETYPHSLIEQAYLCTGPVVRVRRDGDSFYMTYKGSGMMIREEYNLPLTEKAYLHLLKKADGFIISKTRYRIPLPDGLTVELDVFSGAFSGLLLAEVEFPNEAAARSFVPPAWLGPDVTMDPHYHNSYLSKHGPGV